MKSYKEKPNWLVYVNNFIAYILFRALSALIKKSYPNESNILFINTGQIGDLIISSVLLKNSHLWDEETKIYLLIKEKYQSVFYDYNGVVQIIPWNYPRYKFNLIYRLIFLNRIRKLGFKKTINLTAARGVINDEIALLSGAKETYCLNNDWKYLKKLFGKRMDDFYTAVLQFGTTNEYDKHLKVLNLLTGKNPDPGTTISIGYQTDSKIEEYLQSIEVSKYSLLISIAPLTDIPIKNWGIQNYKNLIINILKKFDANIFLIGTNLHYKNYGELEEINKDKIVNIAGKFSILESACIVKKSDVFIGNDSGFTHIAKALNVPHVGIIGGGSYNHFFPYNITEESRYLSKKMECFGCEWRCIHSAPFCHQDVSVEEVIESINLLINTPKK